MCRFTGSKYKDYSPSRSTAGVSYWQRLPTIYEATDVEMAEENDTIKNQDDSERNETEAEELRVLAPPIKTGKKSKATREKNARCRVFFGKPGLIETDSSEIQQHLQEEWNYFLSTPYADFIPENMSASILDGCFSLPSAKKKQMKSINAELQAHQFSEIAAWLEFFG